MTFDPFAEHVDDAGNNPWVYDKGRHGTPCRFCDSVQMVEAALVRDDAQTCNLCGREATLFQATPEGFIGWCANPCPADEGGA